MDRHDPHRMPSVSGRYPAVNPHSGLLIAQDGIFMVLTQAFDGHGHSLIREDSPRFDGFPGVTLWMELPDGRSGELTLSPIHGDPRKEGLVDVPEGTECRLLGVSGGQPLDQEGRCPCGLGIYHRIYLTPQLDRGEVALICNIWGCQRSRVIDDRDLLSWIDY
ncbi:MAG: hypothetical protein JW797_15885 [Bradymonadales bacterium]|nr:hypothetical protein [Bradymonadales bacterium]